MSEFSDSYHLRNGSMDTATDLIRRAGLTGYVLEPAGQWVTFVCAQSNLEPLSSLIETNNGTLVYYMYAEDHSWGFQIYEGHDVTCSYFCDWSSGEIVVDDSELDMSAIERLIEPDSKVSLEELEALFHPENIDEEFDEDVLYEVVQALLAGRLVRRTASASDNGAANKFAQAIGLRHYDWLSYHYVDLTITRNEEHSDWGVVKPVD